jgi:hypothetical protein
MPGMNSVTTANPAGIVAISSTRERSGIGSRPSAWRRRSTSSGPAASTMCTSTTRPVVVSWALCVRIPPSTAVHLRSR